MKSKRVIIKAAVAVLLVLAGTVLTVNLTAKDTSLPYSRYSVDEILYFNDVSTENAENAHIEIAGDGSVWGRFDNSDADWNGSGGSIEPVEENGLTEFIRDQTGMKIAGITDAYRLSNSESTREWLFFSTASGDVYLALVRTEDGAMQSVSALARLKNEFPANTFRERVSIMHPDFMARSLRQGVGREINCIHSYTEDTDSEIVYALFTAGAPLEADEGGETVYTPGVAVFQRTHRNAGMKLLGCGLADDWSVKDESWDTDMRCQNNVISFSLDDGRTLSAYVTLPARQITLFGKGAFEGSCTVRFSECEDPAAKESYTQFTFFDPAAHPTPTPRRSHGRER